MDAKPFDKKKLPSRHVSIGPDRAPHRSYYYAMGMTDQEIAQPFVGVATCWNEAAPCNIALHRQAQAVIAGQEVAEPLGEGLVGEIAAAAGGLGEVVQTVGGGEFDLGLAGTIGRRLWRPIQ